jgi:hypothetical protein
MSTISEEPETEVRRSLRISTVMSGQNNSEKSQYKTVMNKVQPLGDIETGPEDRSSTKANSRWA